MQIDYAQKKKTGKKPMICAACTLAVAAVVIFAVLSGNRALLQQDVAEESGPAITYNARFKYSVSREFPDIELTNPAENTVYFVHEIVDKKSGELIAKTDKMAPGQCTCVNVADFYSEPGRYFATLSTSVYDGERVSSVKLPVEIEVD